MELNGESIDAVLHRLYQALSTRGHAHEGSRGKTLELIGVALRIEKPRARISRSENRGKPFSALGELLWYLSGSDQFEFIRPYVPEYADDAVDGKIEGAYGPRFISMRSHIDQFDSIDRLLSEKPGSRRAVIQLFNAEDIVSRHKEVPCTTTLQFHLRNELLHMSVTMRSNDAYWGLPHDVFCFTMLQEMMARRLGVEMGEYHQFVGSMHVYEARLTAMNAYVEEGIQRTVEMPPMPSGNPFTLIDSLLKIESRARGGEIVDAAKEMNDPYWADVVRLLLVFWAREHAEDYHTRLQQLRSELVSTSYRQYVDGRLHLGGRSHDRVERPD